MDERVIGVTREDFSQWKSSQILKNEEYGKIHVPHKKPLVLQVTVVEGKEITRDSILNLVDDPNPQITVEYKAALGPNRFSTTPQIDDVNPVWNETFTFILPDDHDTSDFTKEIELQFFLIVEDWHDNHDVIGEASYNPSELVLGQEIEATVDFGKKGSITVIMKKEIRQNTDIRFSMKLCDAEMDFRCKRIPKVMYTLRNVLGEDKGPKNLYETPVMSIIGSGGGFRAMIGMCGVMEALQETGLLDCMTYAVGTSGSAWYLSSAYAREALEKEKQEEYHEWFKKSLQSPIVWDLLSIDKTLSFQNHRGFKQKCRQPVTLVDYYGYCLGNEIVGSEHATKHLSDMREYISKADVPYLILATQQVHNSVDTWSYHADCNLSPFECEIPHYGMNFDMKLFNSEMYCGVLTQKLPEPTLRYIQGTVGSAFSLRLSKVFNLTDADGDEDKDFFENVHTEVKDYKQSEGIVGYLKAIVAEWFEALPSFMDRGFFVKRYAEVINFARGHNLMKRYAMNPWSEDGNARERKNLIEGMSPSEKHISIVDAGLLTNIANDVALRPQRTNDILFIFDFCNSEKDLETHHILKKAITLARIGGTKFPPVDFVKICSEPVKELYIFEDLGDEDCPIVFYFYSSTEKFKRIKKYRHKDKNFLEKILHFGADFTNFDVIGSKIYSTFNAEYENVEFERLRELMWFNVIINIEVIKRKISQKILQKQKRLSH